MAPLSMKSSLKSDASHILVNPVSGSNDVRVKWDNSKLRLSLESVVPDGQTAKVHWQTVAGKSFFQACDRELIPRENRGSFKMSERIPKNPTSVTDTMRAMKNGGKQQRVVDTVWRPKTVDSWQVVELGRDSPDCSWEDESEDGCSANLTYAAVQIGGTMKGTVGSSPQSQRSIRFKLTIAITIHGHVVVVPSMSENGEEVLFNCQEMYYDGHQDSHFFGFGEQYTHRSLAGQLVPILCQEQGIGRKGLKKHIVNLYSPGSGGHTMSTYFPVPQYVTNSARCVYLRNTEYSLFDLRKLRKERGPGWIGIKVYSTTPKLCVVCDGSPSGTPGDVSPKATITSYSRYCGRMKALPDWIHSGCVIGLQGGTEQVYRQWKQLKDRDTPIAAFWLQDWEGMRKTMIGEQLWWNWELDRNRYQDWEKLVKDLKASDIRVMGYINSFLVDTSTRDDYQFRHNFYAIARDKGYLVRHHNKHSRKAKKKALGKSQSVIGTKGKTSGNGKTGTTTTSQEAEDGEDLVTSLETVNPLAIVPAKKTSSLSVSADSVVAPHRRGSYATQSQSTFVDDDPTLELVNPRQLHANPVGNLHLDAILASMPKARELLGDLVHINLTNFPAALIDLTNPSARKFVKNIIKKNMIDIGLSGWMADFSEGYPFDAIAHNDSEDPRSYHNQYTVEWAKVNREAIEEAGRDGDIVFFNRSGFTTSPRHGSLFWLGDQNTTWDDGDGLKSAVTGLINGGFSGISLNHSDTGGYTAFRPFMHRTPALLMRWSEANAFGTVFRSHEGNMPSICAQFYRGEGKYNSNDMYDSYSHWSKVFAALQFYRKVLFQEAEQTGIPVVRHPFLVFPNDPKCLNTKYQFCLGDEIMVAPIVDPPPLAAEPLATLAVVASLGVARRVIPFHSNRRYVYLPRGKWVELWTSRVVDCSKGGRRILAVSHIDDKNPPVYYRFGSAVGAQFVANLKASGIPCGKHFGEHIIKAQPNDTEEQEVVVVVSQGSGDESEQVDAAEEQQLEPETGDVQVDDVPTVNSMIQEEQVEECEESPIEKPVDDVEAAKSSMQNEQVEEAEME